MKNLMLIAAMSLLSFFATAQNTALTIGTDLIGFATEGNNNYSARSLNLGIENAFAKRWTISADVSIAKNGGLNLSILKLKDKAASVRTGIKYYPKSALHGFFIGTNLAYTNVSRSFNGQEVPSHFVENDKYVGGGLDIGFNSSLGKRLTFGTFAGLNIMANANDFEDDGMLQYNLGAKIGFKF